jgi:hypothetical protein
MTTPVDFNNINGANPLANANGNLFGTTNAGGRTVTARRSR